MKSMIESMMTSNVDRFDERQTAIGQNITRILNAFFDSGYDKRVRPNYAGKFSFLILLIFFFFLNLYQGDTIFIQTSWLKKKTG